MGELAVDHPHVRDDAAVGVVDRVEDQRAGGRVGVADRGGDLRDDLVEQLRHPDAGLAGDPQAVGGVAADEVGQLGGVLVGLGGGEVDLVEHRDDVQVVLQRQVEVGQGLRLDALRGVDEQHRALARGQGSRHLVGEVDVPRGVDHVEHVGHAGPRARGRRPRQPDRLRLDRDPALALDVHPVEVLRAHLPGLDDPGHLEHPVGERRLAVVDVGDDAEVADQRRVGATGFGGGGHAADGPTEGPATAKPPGEHAPGAATLRACFGACCQRSSRRGGLPHPARHPAPGRRPAGPPLAAARTRGRRAAAPWPTPGAAGSPTPPSATATPTRARSSGPGCLTRRTPPAARTGRCCCWGTPPLARDAATRAVMLSSKDHSGDRDWIADRHRGVGPPAAALLGADRPPVRGPVQRGPARGRRARARPFRDRGDRRAGGARADAERAGRPDRAIGGFGTPP